MNPIFLHFERQDFVLNEIVSVVKTLPLPITL